MRYVIVLIVEFTQIQIWKIQTDNCAISLTLWPLLSTNWTGPKLKPILQPTWPQWVTALYMNWVDGMYFF